MGKIGHEMYVARDCRKTKSVAPEGADRDRRRVGHQDRLKLGHVGFDDRSPSVHALIHSPTFVDLGATGSKCCGITDDVQISERTGDGFAVDV